LDGHFTLKHFTNTKFSQLFGFKGADLDSWFLRDLNEVELIDIPVYFKLISSSSWMSLFHLVLSICGLPGDSELEDIDYEQGFYEYIFVRRQDLSVFALIPCEICIRRILHGVEILFVPTSGSRLDLSARTDIFSIKINKQRNQILYF
jgi:hypothetical protein